MTEDELYDMSDEELEQLVKDEASAAAAEDDTGSEQEADADTETDTTDVDTEQEEELDTDNDTDAEAKDDELDAETAELAAKEEENEKEEGEKEQDTDTEQSDKDSADVEGDDNQDSEKETKDLDGDAKDNLDQEGGESKEEPKLQTYKYKANGQDFEFTEDEVKDQFGKIFGQAMNYTQKMQEIAPWRKTISALKDNEMSHDDVNLMIDVLKGDKDAIASLVKRSGVDVVDIDTDSETDYKIRDYGRSETELAIDDVVEVISKDPEYKITQHVVNDQWDKKSRSMFADNPKYIEGLHSDIKDGTYDAVSPMAMKMKVLDGPNSGKSDIEYYMEAGKQYYANQRDTSAATQAEQDREQAALDAENEKLAKQQKVLDDAKVRDAKQTSVKKAANKRKAAATTKKAAGTKDVIDYLDNSDEGFDAWYSKLQDA